MLDHSDTLISERQARSPIVVMAPSCDAPKSTSGSWQDLSTMTDLPCRVSFA